MIWFLLLLDESYSLGWRLAFHILCVLFFCCRWIYPWLVGGYAVGCWIVFSCFEAEWEWILSGRYKSPSKVMKHMAKSRNDSAANISRNLNNLFSSFDIFIFHRFFFSRMIWRIWAFHMNSIALSKYSITLCHMRLFCTFCFSCYSNTLSSSHLTDYHPLNFRMISLALMTSSRLRKMWPWMVSPAK